VTKQYLGVLSFRGSLRIVPVVALRILVSQNWQERILVVIKSDQWNPILVGKGELDLA